MELSTRTRRALSTALAVFLAVEAVTVVAAAAATTTVAHQLPPEAPAGLVLAVEAPVARPLPEPVSTSSASVRDPRLVQPAEAVAGPAELVVPSAVAVPAPEPGAVADKTPKVAKAPKAAAPAKATKPARATKPAKSTKPARSGSSTRSGGGGGASHSGANHVWIPALGLNRSVRSFPCDRARPPDNYMYRWGCAGSNNVYLMGHAYSVMAPLHDAYVSGRLREGMKAYYAGGDGRVRVYAVRWWKLTKPTTEASWAWAAQDVPSMTLQTCVGKNSAYRLMVRLVEVDG